MQSRTFFFGLEMSQVENMPFVLNKFLNTIKPDTIIEIGTFKGGLSALFQLYAISNKKVFITYDIKDLITNKDLFSRLNVNRKIEDVFKQETIQEIISLIQRKGRTVVFCDGGNKIKEVNLFAQHLKIGDCILAHDYSPDLNYFNNETKGKIWDWCEITDSDIEKTCIENNLEKTFLEFQSVACTCRIKK